VRSQVDLSYNNISAEKANAMSEGQFLARIRNVNYVLIRVY
jgi:hypothetical protein